MLTNEAKYQRAAKYRAWDRKLKKFIYHELAVGQVGLFVTSDDNTPIHLFKHLEAWQQYTGYLSIDGVEVCQGDLLQFPGLNETYEALWGHQKGSWVLFYWKGLTRTENGTQLYWDQQALVGQYVLSEFVGKMQIVGHVHDNPFKSFDEAMKKIVKARPIKKK